MRNYSNDDKNFKAVELCGACGHDRHCGYACWDQTKNCECVQCECVTCLAPNEKIGPTDI